MKIVISNYDDMKNPYYGGGGATAIHNIAKRLSKKHSVIVLSGKYPQCHSKKIDNVTYKYIGLNFGGPKFGQLIYQAFLPIYTKKMEFDIWIESFTPPMSTAFLPLFTKKPVIGLTHFLDSESKSKEYKIPFYLVERAGLKKYNHFIVLTDAVKNKVKERNPKSNIMVIPNGVEINHTNEKINTQKNFILFLGRIEISQKGLDLLLESYNRIKNNTHLPLLIAGGGTINDIEYLKNKIKELGLEKRVKILGKIIGKKKEELMAQASVIVMPSRFETHPLVALEAMDHGCPLLVFNIDGFKWLPSNCAVKVKAFNTKLYADMLTNLIEDGILRKKVINSARKFVKTFDWDLLVEDYNKFISRVVQIERRKNENSHYSRLLTTQ